ncbi:MAG TPA: NfeD family protein [Actinomycetes bacterium]|jgi:membrane-bound serine protease (ClpP class)|nr:NfeD family protein [Actinomycetes bacterium]
MNRLLRLLRLGCLGALLALVAIMGAPLAALAQPAPGRTAVAQGAAGPTVEVFDLSGVLDRSLLGDLRGAVAGAERRGARLLLVQLDGFGGLGVDPAEVARVVAEARVPVAVWVGPRAAQAAGADAFLLSTADVVAVSRQARIGPALPAELGRGRDARAEAALFRDAGLPAEIGSGTVDGARAEALRLADYQAESLPDAVRQLDGRQADGRTLEVTGFQVRFLSSPLLDRVRHGLANPTLAYLLLLAAAACLSFEWFQPGFGVAGIAGLLVALLAVYSLAVLPTSWLALAALVAGTVALTADTARGGLGLLTLVAAALTGAGSWWLFSSPSPLLRVDGRLAVLGTLWSLAWFVVILTVLLRSQRQAPMGTEALVGSHGVVRSVLNPGGIVVIDGAVWRAELAGGGLLATGQRVRVDAVVNGILQVSAENPEAVRPERKRLRPAGPAPRG